MCVCGGEDDLTNGERCFAGGIGQNTTQGQRLRKNIFLFGYETMADQISAVCPSVFRTHLWSHTVSVFRVQHQVLVLFFCFVAPPCFTVLLVASSF